MTRSVCMIVEDQALLGLALEAYLEDTGLDVAGPFLTSADALRWLEAHTPELAVLDIALKDGSSARVARTLKERNVPFAIYSGLKPEEGAPPEFQDVPWLEKPVSREALARTLEGLMRTRSHGTAPPP